MSSFLDLVGPWIPQTPGILPKWLLFISIVSVFNSAQTYFSGLELTRRVYENKPLETTNLSARTFGTWTFVSAVIRFYGAYYLTNPQVYQITLASYLIAFFHFNSEWLIFKTAKFGKGLLGPLIVATSTIVWMTLQKDYYMGLA
ncbi:hypothetical protein WICANDRAFT_63740 [Wickerhamomyces anomalus NRRL Y-366-8]|uniref:Ergosterol biosynthesis protein n=1 Tax=Wickerhamomyces anomalus (strain ATCC 58044 / CBS 1984 / NCYC 433 / NRRL Y-366-8) TaxID=683960 RepID=A0A1E3P184_WICAA|nr:uncharacterized protein WICANDRAFT_63740 [Wickerhamomyces anomalus NRRL Y-366-8]ODQ59246.1 hypothetical protein WICANDRAFT_63740 [Wickerhamomyces anomalus NRRL Y-366-8]